MSAQNKPRVSIAQYIDQQLALSDRSQREIAKAIGYTNSNVLTMIKHGNTKLPINKVGALARELKVDPLHMLQLTITEYMPELWTVLEEIISKDKLVSDEELALVGFLRSVAGTVVLDLADEENRAVLTDAVEQCVARTHAKNLAAVRAHETGTRTGIKNKS